MEKHIWWVLGVIGYALLFSLGWKITIGVGLVVISAGVKLLEE